jgi:hypothetical protein
MFHEKNFPNKNKWEVQPEAAKLLAASLLCAELHSEASDEVKNGRLGSAQQLADEAISIADSIKLTDSDTLLRKVTTRLFAAEIASRADSLVEATDYLSGAIALSGGLNGNYPAHVNSIKAKRADIYLRRNELTHAAADWQSIIESAKNNGNDEPLTEITAHLGYSRALRAMNNPSQSAQHVSLAFNTLPRLSPNDNHKAAFLLEGAGEAALDKGDFATADAFLSTAIQCLNKSDANEGRDLFFDELRLLRARVAACQGDFKAAENVRGEILEKWTRTLGIAAPEVFDLRSDMAFAALEAGEFTGAEQLLKLNCKLSSQWSPHCVALSAMQLADFYRTIGFLKTGLNVLSAAESFMPAQNVEQLISLTGSKASLEVQLERTQEAVLKYEWAIDQLPQSSVSDPLHMKVDLLVGLSIALLSTDQQRAHQLLNEADELIDGLTPDAHQEMLHKIKVAKQALAEDRYGNDADQPDVAALRQQLADFDSRYGQSRSFTRARRLRYLAGECLQIDEREQAIEWLEEARRSLENKLSPPARLSVEYGEILVTLADALPDWHPDTTRIRNAGEKLLELLKKLDR